MGQTKIPLKCFLLNAENLFIFLEHYNQEDLSAISEERWQTFTTRLGGHKPLIKIVAMAELILKRDPQVIALTEVGGEESLNNFNELFLDKRYQTLHLPSNSDRGIDTGFLVKKSLLLKPQIISHNQTPLNLQKTKFFSRGLLELKLAGLHFFLIHLKSKLNKSGDDFEGRRQRNLEVRALAQILKSYDQKPYFLMGDFNGIAQKEAFEAEFAPLYHQLKLFNLTEHLPQHEQVSYAYFNQFGKCFPQQLDYCFTNQLGIKLLDKGSVSFLDFLGNRLTPATLPFSLKEKKQLPSDHYPLEFDLYLE